MKIAKVKLCDYCDKKAAAFHFNKKLNKIMCDKCYQKRLKIKQ